MRKEVVGKPVQKVQHYMALKLTLHMICTLILSSIILNQQIHEALHQVDKRKFHYFPRGTFLAYHPHR